MPPEQMLKENYSELVLKKCRDNHIWLNKMAYLDPSNEMKIQLADTILNELRQSSTQIPGEGITISSEYFRELAELTPVLYLAVNWS
jgi:hypothetical protein